MNDLLAKRLRLLAFCLTVFALIAAGCGSADDGDGGDGTAPTSADDSGDAAEDDSGDAAEDDSGDAAEDDSGDAAEDDSGDDSGDAAEDDSGDDSGDEAEDDSGDSSDDGTSESVLGEPNPADGEPFVVGFPVDTGGESLDNIEAQIAGAATAQYVNEFLGGIEGRPLEIMFCSTRQSPASASECANEFVQNGVSAVILGATPFGEILASAITEAGIPYLVTVAASTAELVGPGAVVLTGDVFATWGAPALYLEEQGLENFGFIGVDVPSQTQGAELLFFPGYEGAGYNINSSFVAAGTADMSANAAAIANSDVFLVLGDAAFCTSALQAVKTQAPDVPIYLAFQCVSSDAADVIPGGYDGVRITQGTRLDPADPETALFEEVLETYAEEDLSGLGRGFLSDAFVATLAFDRLMEGYTGDGSPATVLEQLKTSTATLPLSGGTQIDCSNPPLPFAPNVCSAGAWLVELDENGNPGTEFMQLDNAINLFTGG